MLPVFIQAYPCVNVVAMRERLTVRSCNQVVGRSTLAQESSLGETAAQAGKATRDAV